MKERYKLLLPITKDHVNRPTPENKSISEVRLRYNDQPQGNELCVCGKNRIYSQCCGKTTKTKFKEIVITFMAKEDTKKYHLEITSDGICMYTDGRKSKIISSEIVTTYKRAKSPKVLNKISVPELAPLITPDNLFQYFENVLAVDTNTDKSSGISVCAVASVFADKGSIPSTFSINSLDGKMSVGRCRGHTKIEGIFAFRANVHKPENMGWHIVIESIRSSSAFAKGKTYALIVDSELPKIEDYNSKISAYFLEYSLPDNVNLVYASSDAKNNSLLNFAIAQCDKAACQILKHENRKLTESFGETDKARSAKVNFLHIDDESQVFGEYAKLKSRAGN